MARFFFIFHSLSFELNFFSTGGSLYVSEKLWLFNHKRADFWLDLKVQSQPPYTALTPKS